MPPDGEAQSRFGGLAGGLWAAEEALETKPGSGGNSALARTLDGFCETVLWAGGSPSRGVPGRGVAEVEGASGPLRALGSILAASAFERVLFVSQPETEVERLLALLAYPRHDLVAYRSGQGEPIAAVLCQRESVLAEVRDQLAAGRIDLESLCSAFGAPVLDGRAD